MDKVKLTKEGLEKIKTDLRNLIEVERPRVGELIATARSYGDLSENADYSAAKDRQRDVERKIEELTAILENYELISGPVSSETVSVGNTVTLTNGKKYKIVGSFEVDLFADSTVRCISNVSPLGKALTGKKVGDKVRVECAKPYEVEIKKIEISK